MLSFRRGHYTKNDIELLNIAINIGLNDKVKTYCTSCENCKKKRVCRDLTSLSKHLEELLEYTPSNVS